MGKSLTLGLAVPAESLETYFQAVNQVPILSVEDERDLAVHLRRDHDLEAAQRLVMSHLRFVIYIARGYGGYGLPMADLIQEGNIGLMKAVRRFDPSVNVRLVSFAVHWIRAEIHEFILRNWRIVKVATTKAQRKLFFNLRSAKKRLGWFNQAEVQAVAKDLGVAPETVLEMESRLSGQDTPYDGYGEHDDDSPVAPAAYLRDGRADPAMQLEQTDWDLQNAAQLRTALNSLDKRSRDILENRWLAEKKLTLHNLAGKYHISAERIRQLENSAINKLKNIMVA